MPILGWLSGHYAAQFMTRFSHYAAFAMLAFIGARAVANALKLEKDKEQLSVTQPAV